MIPFVEVLLHTWLDLQRDDEKRTINHHGKELDVGPSKIVTTFQSSMPIKLVFQTPVTPLNMDLIARNEQVEVDAKKLFYANVQNGKEKVEKWRKKGLK